jgi:predicted XRE-type DNA-binding protein
MLPPTFDLYSKFTIQPAPGDTSELRGIGSVGQFCDFLTRLAGRPVIDRTGLAGSFDFRLRCAMDGFPGEDTSPSGAGLPACALASQHTTSPGRFTEILPNARQRGFPIGHRHCALRAAARRLGIGAQTANGVESMSGKTMGSSIDDFLKEEGVFEQAQAQAIKEVIAWQLAQAMKAKNISKRRMAALLKTSRTQVSSAFVGPPPFPGIFLGPSGATISAPPPGIPRCSSAGAPAGDESATRTL